MKRFPIALLILAAGCGGDAREQASTTGATETTPATTAFPTTSTTRGTTTTTLPRTTSTQVDFSVIAQADVEYETTEGWQYRVVIYGGTPDPNPSPGECIDVAPPSLTNLRFVLTITALLEDRPSPSPNIVFSSNLGDSGIPIPTTDPFSEDLAGLNLRRIEVIPNGPDTSCLLASGLSGVEENIAAGGDSQHLVTVGPIDPDRLSELLLGMRLFKRPGEWVEVVFSTEIGSGVVTDSTGIGT